MESGKSAEAGPSTGVGSDSSEENKRTAMKTEKPLREMPFDDVDEEEEEEDGEDGKEGSGDVAAFSPGPLLSLKEQIEKDKVFAILSLLYSF